MEYYIEAPPLIYIFYFFIFRGWPTMRYIYSSTEKSLFAFSSHSPAALLPNNLKIMSFSLLNLLNLYQIYPIFYQLSIDFLLFFHYNLFMLLLDYIKAFGKCLIFLFNLIPNTSNLSFPLTHFISYSIPA